jgi:hypothetical protein
MMNDGHLARPANEFAVCQEKPVETGLHNDLPAIVCLETRFERLHGPPITIPNDGRQPALIRSATNPFPTGFLCQANDSSAG